MKDYIRYTAITTPTRSSVADVINGALKLMLDADTINRINYSDFDIYALPTQSFTLLNGIVQDITFSADVYSILLQNASDTELFLELDGLTEPTIDSLRLAPYDNIVVTLKRTASPAQKIKAVCFADNKTLKVMSFGRA